MTAWLARLKNQKAPDTYPTKPTKPTPNTHAGGFVGFVGYPQGHFQKSDACSNDPKLTPPDADPDCWAWPHSSAMNGMEIATFNARGELFTRRGLTMHDAEQQADKLVQRARGDDDRQLCVECQHLRGVGPWRCGNWQRAGVAVRTQDAGLAPDLILTLQRCPGFAAAALPEDAPAFVAPPAPDPAPAPDPTPPAPDWREADRAYLAHHQQCTACQCAGRGYGQRCELGIGLWGDYTSASSMHSSPGPGGG